VPRLDAERIALWRRLRVAVGHVDRRIDLQMVAEHGLSIRQFDVLSALRTSTEPTRVNQLCAELGEVASSLSRRLDRLEEAGWIKRHLGPTDVDGRTVTVTLTRQGRLVWHDANITFRRELQRHFAQALTETDIAALTRVLGKL
jgi:DNA-binding MarR family transcriptional regulator